MQIEGRIEGTGIPSQFYHTIKVEKGNVIIRIDDANNLAFWLELVVSKSEILTAIMDSNPCLEIPDPGLMPDEIDGKPTARLLRRMEELSKAWAPNEAPRPWGDLGGYVNQFGTRVPNPCHEIDGKGRDMDKIGRWLKPDDKHDDATLDRLNAIVETPEIVAEMRHRQNTIWRAQSASVIAQPPTKISEEQAQQIYAEQKTMLEKKYARKGESLDDVIKRVVENFQLPSNSGEDRSC